MNKGNILDVFQSVFDELLLTIDTRTFEFYRYGHL